MGAFIEEAAHVVAARLVVGRWRGKSEISAWFSGLRALGWTPAAGLTAGRGDR